MTQWSLVARAVDVDISVKRRALTQLIERYIPAIQSYLVGVRRMDRDQAQDAIQNFLTSKVLEDNLISHADQARGKFRTFLLTALNHHLVSDFRRQKAQKRSPENMMSLDEEIDAPTQTGVDDRFDIEWARRLLDVVHQRMQQECEATGRQDIWTIFLHRLLLPTLQQSEPMDYETLVKRFKLQSPSQAFNLLATAKRMYARVMRDVIKEYAGEDADIDSEISDLREILSHA